MRSLHGAVTAYRDWRAGRYAVRRMAEPAVADFDFARLKAEVLRFVRSLRSDVSGVRYRYAASATRPTLYASAYACLTLSLLGELRALGDEDRRSWIDHLDSLQSERDGLFYDPAVANELYADSDWWGARHLALHMINAYSDLGGRPHHPFSFLRDYYDLAKIDSWLDALDWSSKSIGAADVDNKIMNVGCLLQYQRDHWADSDADRAVDHLKRKLRARIDPRTGMWGGFDSADPHQRSRMVQFAYHLFPLYFYDRDFDFDHEQILGHVLRTQNRLGGFGVKLNSSACEDIDSIDLLIRFRPYASAKTVERIDASLRRALRWVLMNQMADGGFVFRLAEPFVYGSGETSSKSHEGALFPTWFRTLTIAYLARCFELEQDFVITPCPGYELT